MSDKSNYTCNCCGAKMVKYKHTLTPILISGLKALKSKGGGPINIRDLGLNRSEWQNFSVLRYFNLVEKTNPENKKGGEWQLTKFGEDFLRGLVPSSKTVQTYRGDVVSSSETKIFVNEVTGRTKNRIDYINEAERI